jgi:hypothetical protein
MGMTADVLNLTLIIFAAILLVYEEGDGNFITFVAGNPDFSSHVSMENSCLYLYPFRLSALYNGFKLF